MYKFQNLNQTLIGMCRVLLAESVPRKVRGENCFELAAPVVIEISNPTDRYITIPERKWNRFLPFAESLWIALGINDLDALPAHYCKNLHKYSDNGTNWRAGYGPRIRAYSGLSNDICVSNPKYRNIYSGHVAVADQLKYVVDALRRDKQTRQAIIDIGDPIKDDFDMILGGLKVTKDFPCTRSIQFIMVDGMLNCIVHMRSNDVLYGLSAVNIFNFTLMQEYVANMLAFPVGKYYHVINNLHMYLNQVQQVKRLAKFTPRTYRSPIRYQYPNEIKSITDFDRLCLKLYAYERNVSSKASSKIIDFENSMFNDWAKVFLFHQDQTRHLTFDNPYLNELFKPK